MPSCTNGTRWHLSIVFLRLAGTSLQHMGGDKIKALAKVLPRMESPDEARLLKNMILRCAWKLALFQVVLAKCPHPVGA